MHGDTQFCGRPRSKDRILVTLRFLAHSGNPYHEGAIAIPQPALHRRTVVIADIDAIVIEPL